MVRVGRTIYGSGNYQPRREAIWAVRDTDAIKNGLVDGQNIMFTTANAVDNDYGYDYTDISVYNRKMDCMFYEPISSVTLDENDNLILVMDGMDTPRRYHITKYDYGFFDFNISNSQWN